MAFLFHIVPKSDWLPAQESRTYAPANFDREKVIHCCHTDQIQCVAHALFRGRSDLLLLRIMRDKVRAKIREGPSASVPASGLFFPFVCGELNLDSVDRVFPLPAISQADFELPKDLLGPVKDDSP